MEKKIKVYLQYPWKFPDSPYYKYLIDCPPRGVEYLNTEKQKGVITNKNFFWFSNFLKRNIRRWTGKLNLAIPNAHLSPEGDYDLIHCAHCLSKNKNKPWVADMEGAWSMFISGEKKKSGIRKVKETLSSKNCKKIMPWTEATKNEILEKFPEIDDKLEVIYPAIPEKYIVKKSAKKIYLIFSGRYFYHKGGLHAIEVIDRLTKKYKNVYGIVNSETPKEILDNYSKNKKIKFYGLISQEELFKLYSKSHLLIYPGYSDSFGFAYLEAMSFGMPIITVDGFARREIVDEGKNGFVVGRGTRSHAELCYNIDKRIVDEMVKKASLLMENKKLRERMSGNCLKEIRSGKFSIKERNKKLNQIYKSSLDKSL